MRVNMHIFLFLSGGIIAFLFAGCSNFSDLAFTDCSSSQHMSLSLIQPSADVVARNFAITIQSQGNPSQVIVEYNAQQHQCTNAGNGMWQTALSLDITKNPNSHQLKYWAIDGNGNTTEAQTKTLRWAYHWGRLFGGDNLYSTNDCGVSVVSDSQGNIYFLGYMGKTSSDTNMAEAWGGNDTIPSSSTYSYITTVTKINADGSYGITKRFGAGSTYTDYVSSLVSDDEGNLYISGYFQSTCDFAEDFGAHDSKTSRGGTDIFLMRVNLKEKRYDWTKTFGTAQNDRQNNVSSSAKLYLDRPGGRLYFTDTVNAGNTNTISVNLGDDFYYDDTKTTHTHGDAFILMLEP